LIAFIVIDAILDSAHVFKRKIQIPHLPPKKGQIPAFFKY
jgi:hypothetical protein